MNDTQRVSSMPERDVDGEIKHRLWWLETGFS